MAEIANKNLETDGGSGSKTAEKQKQKQAEEVPVPQMSEKEEADLLQTPVNRHEPPEILEARRQAIMRQQQQLFRFRENLRKAQEAVHVQRNEIKEYERRNRFAVKPMKLPGDEKPEDVKAKRRLDNPSWQRQVNSVNAKGERV